MSGHTAVTNLSSVCFARRGSRSRATRMNTRGDTFNLSKILLDMLEKDDNIFCGLGYINATSV